MLGSRQPRVRSHPPYAQTYGPEAVELARRAGLVADPWQADIMDVMLAIKPGGKWACFEMGIVVPRQNGKGSILEIRALAGLFLLNEELIMWSAHEYKTAMEGFRRTKALITQLGHQVNPNDPLLWNVFGSLVKISNAAANEGFERLDTKQRIRYIARSKGSGRGFSGDVNIIDEAFAYTPEQQEALMPTVSARPNPQLIYTSSPPLDAISGEPMFNLRERGEAGNDPALGWFDWGAPAGVDPDDREEWARSNPALGIRITEEAAARERRSMGAEGFSRERLGVWPVRSADAIISPAEWSGLADAESEAKDPVALAVDIKPERDYACIAAYGLRPDGLGHAELIDHRPGVDWVVERLVQLRQRHKPVAICLDAVGPAASLLLDLEKAGISTPDDPERPQLGDLVVPSAREFAGACGALVDATRQQQYRHIDQPPLAAAVAGVKTRPLGDAWAWGRRASSVDISPLVAVTLARWAYEARAHLISDEYDPLAHFL